MAEVSIRPYEPRDCDAVVALIRELQVADAAYEDRLRPPEDFGPWYVERAVTECAETGGTLFVAEVAGAVAGYASVFTGRTTEGELDVVTFRYARIGDLVVTAAARGAGIGPALIAACEARARAEGVRYLEVGTFAGNVHARAVYARAGFADNSLVMEKRLD
jgi:GNAT superfamily N-acetyltransferase